MQKPLVIGLGNPLRGDDGFGVLVARQLLDRNDIDCQILHGNATEILAAWHDYARVLILDAMDIKGEAPGTLRDIDLTKEALPARFFTSSSHGMGIYEALELGKVLDDCPQELPRGQSGIVVCCNISKYISVPVGTVNSLIAATCNYMT